MKDPEIRIENLERVACATLVLVLLLALCVATQGRAPDELRLRKVDAAQVCQPLDVVQGRSCPYDTVTGVVLLQVGTGERRCRVVICEPSTGVSVSLVR